MNATYFVLGMICCALLVSPASHAADSLEQLVVLALAPGTGQAVVRWPDGSMRVVSSGEPLAGTGAFLLQVLPDRLVLEEVVMSASQTPIRQQVWLYKAAPESVTSRLLRMHAALPLDEQSLSAGERVAPEPAR